MEKVGRYLFRKTVIFIIQCKGKKGEKAIWLDNISRSMTHTLSHTHAHTHAHAQAHPFYCFTSHHPFLNVRKMHLECSFVPYPIPKANPMKMALL